jgi:hypothetical protein
MGDGCTTRSCPPTAGRRHRVYAPVGRPGIAASRAASSRTAPTSSSIASPMPASRSTTSSPIRSSVSAREVQRPTRCCRCHANCSHPSESIPADSRSPISRRWPNSIARSRREPTPCGWPCRSSRVTASPGPRCRRTRQREQGAGDVVVAGVMTSTRDRGTRAQRVDAIARAGQRY